MNCAMSSNRGLVDGCMAVTLVRLEELRLNEYGDGLVISAMRFCRSGRCENAWSIDLSTDSIE